MRKVFIFLVAIIFLSVIGGAIFLLCEQLPEGLTRRALDLDDRLIVFDMINLTAQHLSMSLSNDPSSARNVKEWRAKTGADLVVNGSYFNDANPIIRLWKLHPWNVVFICPHSSKDVKKVQNQFFFS